jgi:hypothetical protein
VLDDAVAAGLSRRKIQRAGSGKGVLDDTVAAGLSRPWWHTQVDTQLQ